MHQLISLIKQKKELSNIDDTFVKKELEIYFTQHPKLKKELTDNFNTKSKTTKIVVKDIRSILRKVYGVFRDTVNPTKRVALLETFLKEQNEKNIQALLKTHSSTKERLAIYNTLYKKIFKLTNPTIILDLGCGINPLSSFYFPKKIACHVYDLSEHEIALVNDFFAQVNFVKGTAHVLDLFDLKKITKLPKADLALLFKVTDVLDRNKGHKQTEEILQAIPAKYILLSFATKTLSGKKMAAPQRKWVEWLCRRLGYEYSALEFENELFYVIEKNM
jgi:hypothetical protein